MKTSFHSGNWGSGESSSNKKYARTENFYLNIDDNIDVRYRKSNNNGMQRVFITDFNIVKSGNIQSPLVFQENFNNVIDDVNFSNTYEDPNYLESTDFFLTNNRLRLENDYYGAVYVEFEIIAPVSADYLFSFDYYFYHNNYSYYDGNLGCKFRLNGTEHFRTHTNTSGGSSNSLDSHTTKRFFNKGETITVRFEINNYYSNTSNFQRFWEIDNFTVRVNSINESFINLDYSNIDNIKNSNIKPVIFVLNSNESNTNIDSSIVSSYINSSSNVDVSIKNSELKNSNFSAVSLGDSCNLTIDSTLIYNIESNAIEVNNYSTVSVSNSNIQDISGTGIDSKSNSPINLHNVTIKNCQNDGIRTDSYSPVNLSTLFIIENMGSGINIYGNSSDLSMTYSLISHNSQEGIYSSSPINLSFSNITFNEDNGIYSYSSNFNSIENSIIWGNDLSSYQQIYL